MRRCLGFLEPIKGTVVFLGLASAGALVLSVADTTLRLRLLHASSTNLEQLAQHPLRVLLVSAFWLAPSAYLSWAPLAMVVIGAVERVVGTRRVVVAFAVGHVGATLLTALSEWAGIEFGTLSDRVASAPDVGISYGFFSVAGYAAVLLPRRLGVLAVGSLLFYLGLPAFETRTPTTFGHLFALAIGSSLALFGENTAPSRLAARLPVRAAGVVGSVLVIAAAAGGPLELPHPLGTHSRPRPAAIAASSQLLVRQHHADRRRLSDRPCCS